MTEGRDDAVRQVMDQLDNLTREQLVDLYNRIQTWYERGISTEEAFGSFSTEDLKKFLALLEAYREGLL